MCVNDLVVQGAEPLFFLDYLATGALDPAVAEIVIAGIAEGCRQADCALIGGETAEMPGMYRAGDYDLAGFAVGAVERDRLLPAEDIEAGDVVLGLTSNGLHANGFSLVRRIVADAELDMMGEAPFARETMLGDYLLTPTRIYVRGCLQAIDTGAVKALAHITGGGLLENLPRVLPAGRKARLDGGAWPVPEVFVWLQAEAGIAPEEMLRTFNCGVGMAVVCDIGSVPAVSATFEAAGDSVHMIGRIERADGEKSTVEIDGLDDIWL